jgi:hypothetical protein
MRREFQRISLSGLGLLIGSLFLTNSAGQEKSAVEILEAPDVSEWLSPLPDVKDGGNLPSSGVFYERWDGIPGNRVADLRSSQVFQEGQSRVGIISGLATPAGDGSDYGVRLRAWIVAPRTGEVRFAVTSDDNSELWISPDEDPFLRQELAWVKGDGWFGWTDPDQTNRIASQWTQPISMVQGRPYYVEVWHKQGNSADHLSVLWQWKDDAKPAGLPGNVLRPYVLHPKDLNDNGLPDAWEAQTGLARLGAVDAWQDSDGDGVSNLTEFRGSTDPLAGASTAGYLRWDVWFGVPGAEVADLTGSPSFSNKPDRSEFIKGSSTPVLHASNFGARISGFVVPSREDDYEFALSADDSAEFWLSTDSEPENRHRIAFNDTWREAGRWDAVPAQTSSPVRLLAGQSYYIEILHKEQHAPGRIELGWRPVGVKDFSPISSENLRSPGDSPELRARGNMNPEWVAKHQSRAENPAVELAPYGNPSGDGIPNWEKARQDLDPFSRIQRPGGLTREWWFNVPGSSLTQARQAGKHLRRPSMRTLTEASVAEQNTTHHFLSRMRGKLSIPETATYRFWIAGDDHCELWLSEDHRKFRKNLIAKVGPSQFEDPDAPAWTDPLDWDSRPEQRSVEVKLTAGSHRFIEILHKNGNGDDHVAVAWQRKLPGEDKWSAREIIPARHLLAHAGDDDDLDDDYLPDEWETQFGLNPKHNGMDHTEEGESGDFDSDGLTNREEYLLGTDPSNPDTDGDGVSDYDEIHTYGSDPTRKDISPPVELHRFNLAGGISHSGSPWVSDDLGNISTGNRRGAVSFEFELAEPGIHTLVLIASSGGSTSYAPAIPVAVTVSGRRLGIASFPSERKEKSWLTPWLPAGKHTVLVESLNVRANTSLTIHSLTLNRFEGHDSSGFGIPDWLQKFLSARNAATFLPAESTVSPCFIEGLCRFSESVSASFKDGAEIPAFDNLIGHWHADVSLNPDGSPTDLQLNFEDGAILQSHTIKWIPTNLTEAPAVNDLRVGDSIRVLAQTGDSRSFNLRVGDKTWKDRSPSDPITITFEESGTFKLEATLSDGSTTSAIYYIHEADFGDAVAIATGTSRIWTPKNVASPLEITADTNIILEPVAFDPIRNDLRQTFRVSNASPESGSHNLIARLPGSGAILALGRLDSFKLSSGTKTGDSHVIGTLPDGTRIVEVSYVIDGPVPTDLSIWIRLYVTDAIFVNGLTWLELTAKDFDQNGVTRFRVLKAPGEGTAYVCHWILPYADFEDVLNLRPTQ